MTADAPTQPRRAPLHAAGHLALWSGLYAAAALPCFAQLAGLDRELPMSLRLRAALFALTTAAAVYLLDRVKLRDAWLDPADAHAQPRRHAFLTRRAPLTRALVLFLLFAATAQGAALFPFAWALPWLACAGVLIYAARPRAVRPRPKDALTLKNLYVAAGITAFAAAIALGLHAHDRAHLARTISESLAPIALSAAHLAVRVFADAALCDLDDADSDRRFGTRTLPARFGHARAWNIATAIRLALAAALLAAAPLPLVPRLAWAGVTVASTLALRLAAPARIRDWVDVRFPLEAAAVTALLAIF